MKKFSFKKAAKIGFFGSATAIVVGYAAILGWTASGSDRWELELDRNGVKVYSYKESGNYNKIYKGVFRGKYTQNQVVAALMLENSSLENCKKWIPVCTDLKVIEPYSHDAQGDSVLWTLELLPPVFKNRAYSIKTQTSQDPKTGVVAIDVMAAAQKTPPTDCCVRITQIHNRWQISPAQNGEVEIELIQDFDMGGFFPDFLINLSNAEETYKLLHDQFPTLVDKDLYRNARFPYIAEGGVPQEQPAPFETVAPPPTPAGDASEPTATPPAAQTAGAAEPAKQ